MRYDDGWFSPRRARGGYDDWLGNRGGYDAPLWQSYRRGGRGGPAYDAGYGRDRWVEPTRYGPAPGTFPPVHWGGVGPRDRAYDRGYRVRRGGPGRGPGGFFRGGF
jgi:hypothetical protein